MPDVRTIPADVYSLFDPSVDHKVSEDNLESLCENLKGLIRDRLAVQHSRSGALRFSSLGKPDRHLWYDAHPVEGGTEPLLPKTYLKFMYGDVIEQLLLFLVKEAGHEVTHEQHEVEADGVLGHIDAIIDGTVVDVKSASPYGYKKFQMNTVPEDDPFGYTAQLAGYASVLTPDKPAAWLAMDKVGGDICVSILPTSVIKYHQPEPRIKELKEVLEADEPPPRCYDLIPDGKSGNMKLPPGCSYCAHKFRCYPDLRVFLYSTGPRFLAVTAKVPDVPEVTNLESTPDEGNSD